jgi:archaeal flagellar protein FlaI
MLRISGYSARMDTTVSPKKTSSFADRFKSFLVEEDDPREDLSPHAEGNTGKISQQGSDSSDTAPDGTAPVSQGKTVASSLSGRFRAFLADPEEDSAVIPADSPDQLSATPGHGEPASGTAAPVPSVSAFRRFLSIFQKAERQDITTLSFDPGSLSLPSLEGALRDVNITYEIDPPFQYVHIEFSRLEGTMVYRIVEPKLSADETVALTIIENAFEKLVSTSAELIDAGQREKYLHERFYSLIHIFGLKLTEDQKARMYFHLRKQYLGFGRIDTLMKDKYIEDISCNGSDMDIYVQHRTYGSIRTNVRFGEVELNNFVLKLAQVSGRHVSLLQPIRDLTLPDGSRANITLGGEVTKKGSTFTIRKFRANPISSIELMDYGSIDAQQLAFLWILMEYKRSILVSGGTATGKTTFLNVLCSYIPPEYKIVSIEDTAELNLMHPNWIQSITRTGFGTTDASGGASGISGLSSGGSSKSPGDISLYDLLVAALRQRPEFIIVGEVRGGEAFTLFQAIAVGHAALGTIHAGSMDELLARVESNPMNVPRSLLSNLDLVIFPMHIKKGERSMRRISNIIEILELDRDTGDLITNTVFKWVPDIDEFQWQGRSFLFDRIRDTYGVSKDLLNDELKYRTDFILWMQENNIREYHAVTKMIQLYYRDKEEVLGWIYPGHSQDQDPAKKLAGGEIHA